jgi:hypothetical protein
MWLKAIISFSKLLGSRLAIKLMCPNHLIFESQKEVKIHGVSLLHILSELHEGEWESLIVDLIVCCLELKVGGHFLFEASDVCSAVAAIIP